jgi:hypothetical protein
MSSRTRRFAIVMGSLLVVLGIAETVRVLRSGDGGLAFWFGTLVGGGTLILVGVALTERRPAAARALVVVGALAGILPTMWTVVIPALLAVLIVLRVRRPEPPPPPDPPEPPKRPQQPTPTGGTG